MPDAVLGIIPARYASTRFPGKALASIAGKPMIQHVYERAMQCTRLQKVVIATDDERIALAAAGFGAPCQMTRADHLSGTDRVAEVASSNPAIMVVNIQGDEPLIDINAIEAAIVALECAPTCEMSTLCRAIEDPAELDSPNVVKVVRGLSGEAMYFSRHSIPFVRGEQTMRMKHIGLYVYRREFLLKYSALPVGPLERAECLEQLRALENGYRIAVAETGYDSIGVDTPEDLTRIRAWVEARMQRN
ncbi:MAG: 3-deoxy-manno-octulosonate cytidylyltransferase [Bryobacterales bacterium]|nr:3-deoxy-manno-octulosonate cytidylyltransferase [Bryobacterales bacterium]